MKIPIRFRTSIRRIRDIHKYVGNNRTFRQFVNQYDMVYFGKINPKDEAELVRGITMSRSKVDRHYCVGSAYGRDMILLQRSDRLLAAQGSERETYTWNILAIDLKDTVHSPRIYIEGKHRHGVGFYSELTMRERSWVELPPHFVGEYSLKFRKNYVVRMPNNYATSFSTIITPLVGDQMVYYFGMFDYELFDDTLYVYYLAKLPSLERLDHMVKAGVWLADEVEKTYASKLAEPTP